MLNDLRARSFVGAAVVLVGLFLASASAQAALTINREFIGGTPPPMEKLVGGGDLEEIFGVAADAWEDALASSEGNWQVTIKFGWGIGDSGPSWGQEFLMAQGTGNPVRITESLVLFRNLPPDPGFYADPSPLDNSEYTIPTLSNVPGYPTLNNGRVHTGATGDAIGKIDLLTIATHEIGHALGLDYDYFGFKSLGCQNLNFCLMDITAPRPYAGLEVVLGAGPHLADPPNSPLMIGEPQPGQRQLISDLDVLVIEQIGAILPVRATFEVNKSFADGNTAAVEVTLSCTTGLPLVQSQAITPNRNVTFIVESFDSGQLDCTVTEADVAGYTAVYSNGTVTSNTGCTYEDIVFGLHRTCSINNAPVPVAVTVNKGWVIEGRGGDDLDPAYRLVLHCSDEINNGEKQENGTWRKALYSGSSNGTADSSYSALVIPDWQDGSLCWVVETVYDSAIEVSNGCGDQPDTAGLHVTLATGDSCTIANTVFFEGIPTLNYYGMALLACLMLGLGYFGFRRMI